MIKTAINAVPGLTLAVASVAMFLLMCEGLTRLCDKYVSCEKIAISIDDGGSRIEGYTFEKHPGIFRILVLGDSIAYGQGVHKSDTFSKKLEYLFNENAKGRKFEVINTGFMGIDTNQELGILLNDGPDPVNRPELPGQGWQGLAYKPDLILLQYTVSNDAQYYGPDAQELQPPHRWKDGVRKYNYGDYAIPLPENMDRWLTENSRFYLFFLNRYHGFLTRTGLRNEAERIKAMYRPDAFGWLRTRYAIDRVGRIAKAYNIPAVMLLWSTDDGGPLKDVYALVREIGRGRGFYVLDLSKSVQWPRENFAVSMTDGHPNAKAHRLAAEAIYKFLKGERVVPE